MVAHKLCSLISGLVYPLQLSLSPDNWTKDGFESSLRGLYLISYTSTGALSGDGGSHVRWIE